MSGSRCCRFTWGRRRVFVLLLAPAYFAPLRRFAAAYHQRQEALAAAEILAPLSRRALSGTGERQAAQARADEATPSAQASPGGAAPVAVGQAPAARAVAAQPVVSQSLAGRAVASVVPAPVHPPAVVLQDATVRFAGRPAPALAGVSILVPARSVLGVTGASGSGKSTLLRLAGGWLRPAAGQALTDGIPAAEGRRALLIGQHPYLFSGTLADNIALGRPSASRSRIEAAAGAAQLTSLLERLPDGLDTVLGERAWSISGGEAQRVALARAFLSEARFLLVDEPTAHLDAATEAALIEPLARLLQGRTALIASHSDVVLGLAGRVIALDGGRIRG